MAIDDETQEVDDGKAALQTTVAVNDDGGAELPATMAIEEEVDEANANPAANGYELYGDFPETVPMDDGNEEVELPATIAMDGADEAADLPATVPMEDDQDDADEAPRGYGEFPATIPMDDGNEEPAELAATIAIDDENDANDLPATVAIDGSDGEESEAFASVGVGNEIDGELPATVAIDDEPEDEINEIADNNRNEEPVPVPVVSEPLAATMPIDDDITEDESLSQCTQMSSPNRNPAATAMDVDPKATDDDEDTLLQSEKPELGLF